VPSSDHLVGTRDEGTTVHSITSPVSGRVCMARPHCRHFHATVATPCAPSSGFALKAVGAHGGRKSARAFAPYKQTAIR